MALPKRLSPSDEHSVRQITADRLKAVYSELPDDEAKKFHADFADSLHQHITGTGYKSTPANWKYEPDTMVFREDSSAKEPGQQVLHRFNDLDEHNKVGSQELPHSKAHAMKLIAQQGGFYSPQKIAHWTPKGTGYLNPGSKREVRFGSEEYHHNFTDPLIAKLPATALMRAIEHADPDFDWEGVLRSGISSPRPRSQTVKQVLIKQPNQTPTPGPDQYQPTQKDISDDEAVTMAQHAGYYIDQLEHHKKVGDFSSAFKLLHGRMEGKPIRTAPAFYSTQSGKRGYPVRLASTAGGKWFDTFLRSYIESSQNDPHQVLQLLAGNGPRNEVRNLYSALRLHAAQTAQAVPDSPLRLSYEQTHGPITTNIPNAQNHFFPMLDTMEMMVSPELHPYDRTHHRKEELQKLVSNPQLSLESLGHFAFHPSHYPQSDVGGEIASSPSVENIADNSEDIIGNLQSERSAVDLDPEDFEKHVGGIMVDHKKATGLPHVETQDFKRVLGDIVRDEGLIQDDNLSRSEALTYNKQLMLTHLKQAGIDLSRPHISHEQLQKLLINLHGTEKLGAANEILEYLHGQTSKAEPENKADDTGVSKYLQDEPAEFYERLGHEFLSHPESPDYLPYMIAGTYGVQPSAGRAMSVRLDDTEKDAVEKAMHWYDGKRNIGNIPESHETFDTISSISPEVDEGKLSRIKDGRILVGKYVHHLLSKRDTREGVGGRLNPSVTKYRPFMTDIHLPKDLIQKIQNGPLGEEFYKQGQNLQSMFAPDTRKPIPHKGDSISFARKIDDALFHEGISHDKNVGQIAKHLTSPEHGVATKDKEWRFKPTRAGLHHLLYKQFGITNHVVRNNIIDEVEGNRHQTDVPKNLANNPIDYKMIVKIGALLHRLPPKESARFFPIYRRTKELSEHSGTVSQIYQDLIHLPGFQEYLSTL